MADLFNGKVPQSENQEITVDEYKFDALPPIKGFPELRWRGKMPYNHTRFFPAQKKESYGSANESGWLNKIFWGDNLQVMSHLLKKYRGKIDLIYIDPPFDSKADYKKKIELKGAKATNDHTAFEEKQYGDMWNNDEYLQFIYERLILMRELLADTGSIYLHCDWHKSHHLRCIMDEVFGTSNFVNEIVWQYFMGGKGKNEFAKKHDTILFYAKNAGNHTFNKFTVKRYYDFVPSLKDESSNAENGKDEVGYYSIVACPDVWPIKGVFNMGNEYLAYPTQKPEALLERIIKASSNEGDLIFDCFMGSGTSMATALKMGRRFIGADINLGAIETTVKRLNKIISDDPSKTGFEVYNVNNYDVFRNPVEAKNILRDALEITPLDRNVVFDGEKDGWMVKIMPVNRIANREDLNDIINNADYAALERARDEDPSKPAMKIELVCMGHEADLGPELTAAFKKNGFDIEVKVSDILRNDKELEFKRSAEARIVREGNKLVVKDFFPMNLLQKLSLQREHVEDWKELVTSIKIDWNYDGVVFEPAVVDYPESKKDLVQGSYDIPADAGHIKIKITDLLDESFEQEL